MTVPSINALQQTLSKCSYILIEILSHNVACDCKVFKVNFWLFNAKLIETYVVNNGNVYPALPGSLLSPIVNREQETSIEPCYL